MGLGVGDSEGFWLGCPVPGVGTRVTVGAADGAGFGSAVGKGTGLELGGGVGGNVGDGDGALVAAQQLPHSLGQSQNHCRLAVPAAPTTYTSISSKSASVK